jgi:hypothetical protein
VYGSTLARQIGTSTKNSFRQNGDSSGVICGFVVSTIADEVPIVSVFFSFDVEVMKDVGESLKNDDHQLHLADGKTK